MYSSYRYNTHLLLTVHILFTSSRSHPASPLERQPPSIPDLAQWHSCQVDRTAEKPLQRFAGGPAALEELERRESAAPEDQRRLTQVRRHCCSAPLARASWCSRRARTAVPLQQRKRVLAAPRSDAPQS